MARWLVVVGLFLLTGCEEQAMSEAKLAVKAKMIDPDSAKFEDVQRCPASHYVRGYVNGKNRLGAYAGAALFYASDTVAFISGDAGSGPAAEAADARFFDAISRECSHGDGLKKLDGYLKHHGAATSR